MKLTKRLTFFLQLLKEQAKRQNVVLEKEARGYSLYSNTTFTGTDCANLAEVADILNSDSSFK